MRNLITEEEKNRILQLHINNGYKTVINEAAPMNPESVQWKEGEYIQKGMRNNDKVRVLQSYMSLTGRKGQNLVTGYFGPLTDGGLVSNYANSPDIQYKSGMKIDKPLFDKIIYKLKNNITSVPGKGDVQGGAREDLTGVKQDDNQTVSNTNNIYPSSDGTKYGNQLASNKVKTTSDVTYRIDPNWLEQNNWLILKDGNITDMGKTTIPSNKVIVGVYEPDYNYILVNSAGDKVYGCQTGQNPECISINRKTGKVEGKSAELGKVKSNVFGTT